MRPSAFHLGVKGLIPAIKKLLPDLIKDHDARWLSPTFKGKTVALDGNLLTARFFFSGRGESEYDEMYSKRIITGWHRLITKMRASQVTPIAVFDGKGDRIWKEVAHTERDGRRSLALARSMQESVREDRIEEFGKVLKEVWAWGGVNEAMKEGEEVSEGVLEDRSKDREVVLEELGRLREEVESMARPLARPKRRGMLKAAEDNHEEGEEEAEVEEVEEGEGREAQVPALSESFTATFPAESIAEAAREEVGSLETDEPATSTIPADEADVITNAVPPAPTAYNTPRQVDLNTAEHALLADALQVISTLPSPSLEIDRLNTERLHLLDTARIISAAYKKAQDMPTSADMAEAMELLEMMGVPVLIADAPYEAEGLCSAMVKEGMADFVGTEDTDVLAYRQRLLRNVADSSKPLSVIDGEEIRGGLAQTEKEYLDFMVLCGVDACERIYNVGPTRAIEFLKKYGNIEAIVAVAKVGNVKISGLVKDRYLERVGYAREVFTMLPPTPPREVLEGKAASHQEVAQFLRDTHGIILDGPADGYTPAVVDYDLALESTGSIGNNSFDRPLEEMPQDFLADLGADLPEFPVTPSRSFASPPFDPSKLGRRYYHNPSLIGVDYWGDPMARLRREYKKIIRQIQAMPDVEIRYYLYQRARKSMAMCMRRCKANEGEKLTMAHRALQQITNVIVRANRGDIVFYQRLLDVIYGRTGKRHWEALRAMFPDLEKRSPSRDRNNPPPPLPKELQKLAKVSTGKTLRTPKGSLGDPQLVENNSAWRDRTKTLREVQLPLTIEGDGDLLSESEESSQISNAARIRHAEWLATGKRLQASLDRMLIFNGRHAKTPIARLGIPEYIANEAVRSKPVNWPTSLQHPRTYRRLYQRLQRSIPSLTANPDADTRERRWSTGPSAKPSNPQSMTPEQAQWLT